MSRSVSRRGEGRFAPEMQSGKSDEVNLSDERYMRNKMAQLFKLTRRKGGDDEIVVCKVKEISRDQIWEVKDSQIKKEMKK